jgi:hypothetical protein
MDFATKLKGFREELEAQSGEKGSKLPFFAFGEHV